VITLGILDHDRLRHDHGIEEGVNDIPSSDHYDSMPVGHHILEVDGYSMTVDPDAIGDKREIQMFGPD
jgi:hypothetical protein